MRDDWPLPPRALLAALLLLLAACAAPPPAPGQGAATPLALTDENFYGQLGVESVHPNEAMARVAMAECAAIGALSASAQGRDAAQMLHSVVLQLQPALRRAGANAFAMGEQRWEPVAGAAGNMRLEIVVQGLICSA